MRTIVAALFACAMFALAAPAPAEAAACEGATNPATKTKCCLNHPNAPACK